MESEELKPLKKLKRLSNLSKEEFNLLITSSDPKAVQWRKLHKKEFQLRLRASDLLNDFFNQNFISQF